MISFQKGIVMNIDNNASDILKEHKYLTLKLILGFTALSAAYFLSSFHRFSMGIASIYIADDFSLDSAQLGLLGSVYFYSYALIQIPAGLLADKYGVRLVLSLASLLSGIASIMFAMSDTFAELLLTRTLTGAALAFIYVPALSAIRSMFDEKSYGFVLGIFIALGQIGSIITGAPLKLMIGISSWRVVFTATGIIFISIFIIALAFLDKKRNDSEQLLTEANQSQEHVKDSIFNKNIYNPVMLIIILWFFILGGARFCYQSLWASHYYIDVIGMTENMAGVMLTVIAAGSCFGAIMLGKVSDKYGSMRTIVICSFIFSSLWFLIIISDFIIYYRFHYLLNFIFGYLASGMFTSGYNCVKLFAKIHNAGILNGACNCFLFIGTAVFTQISGLIIEYFKWLPESGRYYIILVVFGGLSLLCSVLLYAAGKKINT